MECPIRRITCADTDRFIHPAFVELLKSEFGVHVDDNDPDLVLFGPYPGYEFLKHKGARRLFLTEENVIADFNLADFAFGYAPLEFGDRYMRLPNYFFYPYFEDLARTNYSQGSFESKDRFCNFIYSNPEPDRMREQMFRAVSRYKHVHAHGRQLNNAEPLPVATGFAGWNAAKLDVLKRYKFTIVCENSSSPGYTTEKLTDALYAHTVPIYWGNPDVARDFNPERMVNFHCCTSLDEVVAHVKRLDRDDDAYRGMLTQPIFDVQNLERLPTRERVIEFLRPIMLGKARGRNLRVWGEIYERRFDELSRLYRSSGHLPAVIEGLQQDLASTRKIALDTISRYAEPTLADTAKVGWRFLRTAARRALRK